MAGYEVLTEGRGSNSGTCIINLKPWDERKRTARQIIVDLEEKCRKLSNVKLEFFEPPAVPGFGTAGGISMLVLDKTFSADYQHLGEVTTTFMAELKKRKEVTNLFTFYAANYPQYEFIIDNDKAMQKGVSIKAAMDSLNILIGSTWEQGFILFNQFYKVFVQAKPEFRRYPEDLDNLFVKNDKGEMVPYSAFITRKTKQGLNGITRYNLYTSAAIQCAPAPGYSTGQAIQAIKEVGAKLPRGFDVGWSGLSYDESRKGNEAIYIFLIVVAFVYLVLVAQYESFILPLAVILSLPVGLFGSFFFLRAMGLTNDVYAQIGLVMLVGLLGKNAILIVEFAVQRRMEGVSLQDAAVEGAKLRFRPIQMTSFAFIAGLLPLVVATGAGAIGNRTIGSTGAGGMLVGTIIGVLIIPGLYYLFGQLDGGRNSSRTSRVNLSANVSSVNQKQCAIAMALIRSTAEGPVGSLRSPKFHKPAAGRIPELDGVILLRVVSAGRQDATVGRKGHAPCLIQVTGEPLRRIASIPPEPPATHSFVTVRLPPGAVEGDEHPAARRGERQARDKRRPEGLHLCELPSGGKVPDPDFMTVGPPGALGV